MYIYRKRGYWTRERQTSLCLPIFLDLTAIFVWDDGSQKLQGRQNLAYNKATKQEYITFIHNAYCITS